MYSKASTVAYALAIFVLMNALFVVTNANDANEHANYANRFVDSHNSFVVSHFKQEIREAFKIALLQTIGDKPWFENLEVAITGIVDFYDQSASAMTALISPTYAEDDLFYIANQAYLVIARQAGTIDEEGEVAGLLYESEYMQDEPLYNIHPDFNFQPEDTGQLYCLAIYNGETNKYLGECKYDENF